MAFTVTVKLPPIEVAFDAGSLAEAHAILTEQNTALTALFSDFSGDALAGSATGSAGSEQAETAGTLPDGTTPARKRGRPSTKNQTAAATASAPAPAPIPGASPAAPPTAPLPAGHSPTSDGGIPPFLDRTGAAAPPPPPPAAAPPLAPPASKYAPLVIADLKKRAAGAADKGQSLADWVAQTGLVVKGATFDETCAVLQFQGDDKLAPVAAALGIQ